MSRYFLLIVLFGGMLLYISCYQESRYIEATLQEVDIMAETAPDSALALLSTISKLEELPKSQYARYIVVQAKAKVLASKDLSSDTLIFWAKRYYPYHGDEEKKALVDLYCGIVSFSRKDYETAMISLAEAKSHAQKTNNNDLKGRIESYIGQLYLNQFLYDKAIEQFLAALEYSKQSPQNEENIMRNYHVIGATYVTRCKNEDSTLRYQNYDIALNYYRQSYTIAIKRHDSTHIAMIRHNEGIILRNTGRFAAAKDNFLSVLPFNKDSTEQAIVHLNLAQVYFLLNKLDSAEYYMDFPLKRFKEINNTLSLASAYDTYGRILNKKGDYRQAFQFQYEYGVLITKLMHQHQHQNILEVQAKYDFGLLQNEKNKQIIQKRGILIVAMLLLFLAVGVLFFFYRKNLLNKKLLLENDIALEREKTIQAKEQVVLSNALQQINELQDLIKIFGNKEDELRNFVYKRFELDKRSITLERYLQNNKVLSGKEFIQKMNGILYGQEERNWEDLYHTVNEYYNGFLNKLWLQYPQLGDIDYKICCLTYARFDNTEISIILKMSKDTVQKRKSRIRQRLNMGEREDLKAFFQENVKI